MAKIFVIDDDPGIVALLERHLRARGYETASAGDGMTAAQVCAREKPDLVLLDFYIPAADGRIMLDRLRALPGFSAMPVLVITGGVLTDVMALLPDRGLRFLEKPLDLALLDKMVAELLGPKAVRPAPAPAPAAPSLPPIPPLAGRPDAGAPAPLQLGGDDDAPASGETLDLDI